MGAATKVVITGDVKDVVLLTYRHSGIETMACLHKLIDRNTPTSKSQVFNCSG